MTVKKYVIFISMLVSKLIFYIEFTKSIDLSFGRFSDFFLYSSKRFKGQNNLIILKLVILTIFEKIGSMNRYGFTRCSNVIECLQRLLIFLN